MGDTTEKRCCGVMAGIGRGVVCIVSLALLAAAFGYAGMQIREGLTAFNSENRVVTVKGLAEREVVADLALWPISYTETGNDLSSLQATMEEKGQTVINFLKRHGITENEIELQQVNVQDLLAQSYRQGNIDDNRYILTQGYMVRTDKVDQVAKAAQQIGSLVKAGVVLSQQGSGPIYLFTKLNDIKPQMIAEATGNAREAAQQFAADSGEIVGGIRRASQGVFQILPRDDTYMLPEQNQVNKNVRVVTTIEFTLE